MAAPNVQPPPDPRLVAYRRIVALVFLLIAIRLFYMQVHKYPDFLKGAVSNKIKFIPHIAPRGQIFDRAGRPLAVNEPVFSLMYFPPLEGGEDEALPPIAAALGEPVEALAERIEKEKKRNYPYQPVSIRDNLTPEQVIFFSENSTRFPGVFVEENNYRRKYPLGAAAAHVIGYTGAMSEKDPKAQTGSGYDRLEFVGKTGAEKAFEEYLHGRAGSKEIEVTKNRAFKRLINETPAKSGQNIYLTIDSQIQARIFELFKGRRGCAIVSKPFTGEIIAMVSSPSYDANLFYLPQYADYRVKLLNDKVGMPEFFRAIGGTYPPGSTFKLVTAIAALETGKASENMQWTCPGTYELGNRIFREEYVSGGHGPIVFKDAIGKSCDIVFWKIGVETGSSKLAEYARRFGFGDTLGIELAGEKKGFVPDRSWKKQIWKDDWWAGDTANMSIGQGFVLATPLQVLWSVNAIVTDGDTPRPHILKGYIHDGKMVESARQPNLRIHADKSSFRIVREGMRRAVLNGTAKQLRGTGISSAGKTGTADAPHGKEPHGWFVGYFPYENPEYSVVVLLENAGKAADSAVPLAGEIIKQVNEVSKGK
ncbi:MAG: penicillin-binding protein 2 [bacterium]